MIKSWRCVMEGWPPTNSQNCKKNLRKTVLQRIFKHIMIKIHIIITIRGSTFYICIIYNLLYCQCIKLFTVYDCTLFLSLFAIKFVTFLKCVSHFGEVWMKPGALSEGQRAPRSVVLRAAYSFIQ